MKEAGQRSHCCPALKRRIEVSMNISTTTRPGKVSPCPGFPCPRCGRQHMTWWKLAECRFKALWAQGRGPWASLSRCGPGPTVILYPTQQEAEEAKRFLDRLHCGGRCNGDHRVVYIGEEVRA